MRSDNSRNPDRAAQNQAAGRRRPPKRSNGFGVVRLQSAFHRRRPGFRAADGVDISRVASIKRAIAEGRVQINADRVSPTGLLDGVRRMAGQQTTVPPRIALADLRQRLSSFVRRRCCVTNESFVDSLPAPRRQRGKTGLIGQIGASGGGARTGAGQSACLRQVAPAWMTGSTTGWRHGLEWRCLTQLAPEARSTKSTAS